MQTRFLLQKRAKKQKIYYLIRSYMPINLMSLDADKLLKVFLAA